MALLPPIVMNQVVVNHGGTKDSRWLMLDVCREFTRNKCTRTEDECRFAHPSSNVEVQNGKVICCFDSIKGKCQRQDPPCKYLHPPQHLKEQLLQNGRRNLILRHIQAQFIMNGVQRVVPVHQFSAQNGAAAARYNTYYPTTYTSFPSLVQGTGQPQATIDTSGPAANDQLTDHCQMNGTNGNLSVGDGVDSTALVSPQQTQHQVDVWSGAGTPPSSMVAVDSNGYVTSYCSPVYSPVYFQRACAIPGMMPMVKTDAAAVAADTKYEQLPVYHHHHQPPPPPPPVAGLTYPQMMISSSMPYQTPYFPIMIPGPVTSAMPRY